MQLERAAYLVYSALKNTKYCGIAVEWWHSDCIKLHSPFLPCAGAHKARRHKKGMTDGRPPVMPFIQRGLK